MGLSSVQARLIYISANSFEPKLCMSYMGSVKIIVWAEFPVPGIKMATDYQWNLMIKYG